MDLIRDGLVLGTPKCIWHFPVLSLRGSRERIRTSSFIGHQYYLRLNFEASSAVHRLGHPFIAPTSGELGVVGVPLRIRCQAYGWFFFYHLKRMLTELECPISRLQVTYLSHSIHVAWTFIEIALWSFFTPTGWPRCFSTVTSVSAFLCSHFVCLLTK